MNNNRCPFELNNQFDAYYLFLDSEIIRNKTFCEKIELMNNIINSTCLKIKVILPIVLKNSARFYHLNIPSEKAHSLEEFFEIEIAIDKNTSLLSTFDFYIQDERNLLEGFISFGYELAIFGCNKSIIPLFDQIIKPYHEISLKNKKSFITDLFSDMNEKERFITSLEDTFHFKCFDKDSISPNGSSMRDS